MVLRAVIIVAGAAGLISCGSPTPTAEPAEQLGPTVPGQGNAETNPTETRLDIGDVEAHVSVAVRLHSDSQSGNIVDEEAWSRRQRLAMATVDVGKPYPDELWASVEINSRHAFTTEAVLLTSRVIVAGEEVARFTNVLGADAASRTIRHKVDVLENIDTLPETMLVRVETDATLYLDKTPEDIDPETAERPEEWSAVLQSNPMRVNFVDNNTNGGDASAP